MASVADSLAPIADRRDRPEIRAAGRVVAGAGALGVIGQLLFFDVALGINFPIAIAMLLAGGWLLRRRREAPPLADAWLGPIAVAFASFAAIRADPFLVALDVLAALALAGGALASFAGRDVLRRPFGGLVSLAAAAAGWAVAGAIPAVSAARDELPPGSTLARRIAPVVPVLRGLLIAIPLVLVFVALFSSADAVFASLVDDLVGVRIELGDAAWRLVLALVIGWLAAGALALAASTPGTPEASPAPVEFRLGTTELIVVLLTLDALFVGFVALQAAYLFGGFDTMRAAGLTYAEYARRGFAELVVVAALAGGVVVAADRLAAGRRALLVGAAVVLALMTGVVLASAALRMQLYQEAYGWTELRLYVLATIVVLAAGIFGLVAALIVDRVGWIGHLLVAAALLIGGGLNVIGPVRFITEENVARVIDPARVPPFGRSGLDVSYVVGLGDDGVPALIRALGALPRLEADHLRGELAIRLAQLRSDPGLNAWQAWNAGRAGARDALEAASVRGELP